MAKRRELSPKALEFLKKNVGKMTDLDIAKKLGISSHRVAEYRFRRGIETRKGRPRMSREAIERILEMRRKGLSVSKIARHLDRSRQWIHLVITRSVKGKRKGAI